MPEVPQAPTTSLAVSGQSELFANSPFVMPESFSNARELPETLRLQLVKTYGDETTEHLSASELQVASAIACFDVLREREEFTDDKHGELLALLLVK